MQKSWLSAWGTLRDRWMSYTPCMKIQKTHRLKAKSKYNLWLNLFTFEKEHYKQNEKIQKLEENIEKLEKSKNLLLVASGNNLVQYSCRNYPLLHGVKKTKDKNTDEVTIKTFSEEMNTVISHEDLDRMHRTDKKIEVIVNHDQSLKNQG